MSYEAVVFPTYEILPDYVSFYRDKDLKKLVFIVNAFENDTRITNGGMNLKIAIIGNLTLQSGTQVTAQQIIFLAFKNKNGNL